MAKFFFAVLTFALLGMINCGYSSGNGGNLPGSINHPIFSKHNVVVKKVAGSIQRNDIPEIVISSGAMKMKMVFESQSTDLDVTQKHTNADGKTESTSSQDGQIVLNHQVTKPVVQYVSEEIVPTRYLSQKIRPVQEFVKTVVAKNAEYTKPSYSSSSDDSSSYSGATY